MDIIIDSIISEGRTFRIYKARRKTKYVILKVPVKPDSMTFEILYREYEISCNISHPCIVRTIGFEYNTPIGPAIIFEYIEGLTLISHIPTFAQKKKVLRDILDAVDCLHHHGILHNDIKPSNILINSNESARIIDFGLSSSDDSLYNGCIGGSNGYSSPEVLNVETSKKHLPFV